MTAVNWVCITGREETPRFDAVRRLAQIASLSAMLAVAPAFAGGELRERVGHAYHPGSGTLVYTEHHQEWWMEGRILRDTVTYRDPQDNVIAEKHVDFRGNERAPEFLLRNVLTGHAEGARLAPAGLEVSFRERHGMPPKQELLTVPDGAIVDAGFDRFIESNWEALVRGDTLVRPFLVPSRLQFMDFRIRRVEVQGGREGVVFRLSIDSLLLGLVAPDITVVYDTSTRTLVEYVGVSNMRDAEGNNQDVRIRFGDRRNLTAALEGSAGAGVSSRSDTGNPSRP